MAEFKAMVLAHQHKIDENQNIVGSNIVTENTVENIIDANREVIHQINHESPIPFAGNDNSTCDNDDDGGASSPPQSVAKVSIEGKDNSDNIAQKAENTCNRLNQHVSMHANAYTPSVLVDQDTALNFPAVPDNPLQLTTFVTIGEKAIDAAKILCAKPNLSAQEYLALHNKAKEQGYILLAAALKLSIQINNIETHQGKKECRTKEQILQEDFHLTQAQARRIDKLTVEAVDKEKKRARDQDDIPTVTGALKYAKAADTKLKKAKEKATQNVTCNENSPIVSQNIENRFDIIYADFNKFDENFNLSKVANDNALLYLWVNNTRLAEGINAIAVNGFEYSDNVAFIRINCQRSGKYIQNYHDLILIAAKGDFPKPELFKDKSVIYEADVIENGSYRYCKEIIQKMYPDASLLDLTVNEISEVKTENAETKEEADFQEKHNG